MQTKVLDAMMALAAAFPMGLANSLAPPARSIALPAVQVSNFALDDTSTGIFCFIGMVS